MIQRFSLDGQTRSPSGETNAYVVGETNGIVIDPAREHPELTRAVQERAEHVAVTHYHPDHIGAVESYAEEWNLAVWALAGRGEAFEHATGIQPDRRFFPGETVPVAGGIEILDTPGHAPEHVSFVVPDGIITGDVAVDEGSVVVGAPDGDMRAYLTSLRRLYARNPERLYPGHGPVIEAPRSTCKRLIQHRLRREHRVLDAIEAGNETLDEIVGATYEKDISAVYDLAKLTVVAHIEKLAVEGRITYDGERAVLA